MPLPNSVRRYTSNIKKHFWKSLPIIMLAGCAAAPMTPPDTERHSEKVFDKNYVIGREQATYVGDPVVRLRDYIVTVKSIPAFTPTASFQVRVKPALTPVVVQFDSGTVYQFLGSVEDGGVQQALVKMPRVEGNQGIWALGVFSDGSLTKTIFFHTVRGWIKEAGEVLASDTVRMERSIKREADQHALFENFELIYNGTDGRSVFLTYREFSPDNLARPAFFQNLTYDIKSETIRFKKYKIKLVGANAETIRTIVLEDGR